MTANRSKPANETLQVIIFVGFVLFNACVAFFLGVLPLIPNPAIWKIIGVLDDVLYSLPLYLGLWGIIRIKRKKSATHILVFCGGHGVLFIAITALLSYCNTPREPVEHIALIMMALYFVWSLTALIFAFNQRVKNAAQNKNGIGGQIP